MSIVDKLKEAFSGEEEEVKEITTALSKLHDVVKEEKKQEIREKEEEVKELTKQINQARLNVLDKVRELENTNYSVHMNQVQSAVKDLKKSFCKDAKKNLENLETQPTVSVQGLKNYMEQYKEALNNLKQVKYRQAAALIKFRKYNEVKKSVKKLESRIKYMQRFLTQNYTIKQVLNQIKKTQKDIKQFKRELKDLNEQGKKEEVQEAKRLLKKAEEELEEYKKDKRHKQIEKLKEEKRDLEKSIEETKKYINIHLSGIDRALRKFRHAEAGEPKKIADELLEYPFQTYLNKEDKVKRLLSQLIKASKEERIDLSKQVEKKVKKTKKDIDKMKRKKKKIEKRKEKIKEKQKKIDSYSNFLEKEGKLKKNLKGMKEEEDRRKKELKQIQEKKKRLKKKVKKLRKKIEKEVNKKVTGLKVKLEQ